jgi:heat shock protein HtpX
VNALKTGILLVVIGVVAVAIGRYFFGTMGAIFGLLIALGFQGFSLFAGHKIALSMARARPLLSGEMVWYQQAAEQLSRKAGIPTPDLYLSPDPQPNAFAAGRSPSVAVVCVNQGLVDQMPRDQVIAVLAHEIGHIKNRDILTMTVTAGMVTFISFLANIAWFIPRGDNEDRNPFVDLLMMLLAPIGATIIQLAISRTREFAADRTAAELMGDARPMMGALASLERGTSATPSYTAQGSTAHMYIASPFRGGGIMKLFSTHPPIEDRIAALRKTA